MSGDGNIAEGFDKVISKLCANQWYMLPEVLEFNKESRSFRELVYKRIWSEAVPPERWQSILKKAKTDCPAGGKEFCVEIILAARRG